MAKQSNAPQRVNEHVWYYEEGRKFGFVVESAHLDRHTSADTVQFYVPVSMLERSLARTPRKRRKSER
jgi:hypothetical protein